VGSVNGKTESPSPNFEAITSLSVNLSQLRARAAPTSEALKLNTTLRPKEPTIEDMIDIEMTDDDPKKMNLSGEVEIDKTPEEMDLSLDEPETDTAKSEFETLTSIFRAYDIRGVVGDSLTADVVTSIGCAIGTYVAQQGEQTLIVGGDARSSTPELMAALIEGLNVSGRDVISIGKVPTPALYFAVNNSGTTNGVMVTGSHNEAKYNGLKIVIGGKTLIEEDLQEIRRIFDEGSFSSGKGSVIELDIMTDYTDVIVNDIVIKQPLKVVVDGANGIAGETLPPLFSDLGCDVIPLYCDVDSSFPNHPPDPTVKENLADLINTVINEGADLGLALDGDADRVMAVTHDGTIIWPDQLLMLFAKDVLSRNPGSDVVYDIKCTRHLNTVISNHGGRPVMSRSGQSFIKAKMAETNAILGGELSGHICFNERWFGFDDGIYAAARLIEIVGSQMETLADLMAEFPVSCGTPEIRVPVAEASKFHVIQKLVDEGGFGDGTITTLDGLRVDYADGWGLVRASNTTPSLTLRFEADDEARLAEIKHLFRNQLQNHNLTF